MNEIRFDTFYRYEALVGYLRHWAEMYPHLCRLESIGQSHEGRDIWLMTLTRFDTGADDEKPAYWIDGNIHATEVSASTAALYLSHRLLSGYDDDPRVTYALDSRVFYVAPRLNPDGAEWALADRPRFVRSGTRPYPREEELDGLHLEDIDGDGRILQMRVKDPNGGWKINSAEPRLLTHRDPDEAPGGDFYHLLPEGRIHNYDGVMIKMAPSLQGLDFNRQFPVFWAPEESGAGPYPGSEPEIRAVVEFVTGHPNITGSISFHTYSGVHLRPPTREGDDSLPTQDLHTYKKIGQKAEALTGYPAVSVFHDFKYDPKEYIKGTFDDWMYEYLGVYGWTTEIWSLQRQAGITDYKFIDWFREHPVADDLALLRWNDEVLDGQGYVAWYPFDHPQLGPVELGGWHTFHTWRNPPLKLLEKEVAPLADFALYSALISPKLELRSLDVDSHGDIHHIRLVVENTGWLPTNVTQMALKRKVVRDLEITIELPPEATLLSGEARTVLGQLAGRDHSEAVVLTGGESIDQRAKGEWVVQAPAGSRLTLTATHQRAGTVRTEITVGAT